jgi:hypothetical protein
MIVCSWKLVDIQIEQAISDDKLREPDIGEHVF